MIYINSGLSYDATTAQMLKSIYCVRTTDRNSYIQKYHLTFAYLIRPNLRLKEKMALKRAPSPTLSAYSGSPSLSNFFISSAS